MIFDHLIIDSIFFLTNIFKLNQYSNLSSNLRFFVNDKLVLVKKIEPNAIIL